MGHNATAVCKDVVYVSPAYPFPLFIWRKIFGFVILIEENYNTPDFVLSLVGRGGQTYWPFWDYQKCKRAVFSNQRTGLIICNRVTSTKSTQEIGSGVKLSSSWWDFELKIQSTMPKTVKISNFTLDWLYQYMETWMVMLTSVGFRLWIQINWNKYLKIFWYSNDLVNSLIVLKHCTLKDLLFI